MTASSKANANTCSVDRKLDGDHRHLAGRSQAVSQLAAPKAELSTALSTWTNRSGTDQQLGVNFNRYGSAQKEAAVI